METKLIDQPLPKVQADAVAVVVFEDVLFEEAAPAELKSFSAWLDELKSSGEFSGKGGDLVVLHQPQGLAARRLVVAGGGKQNSFDAASLRKTVASVVRAVKQKGVKTLGWWLADGDAEAAVEG